MRQINIPEPVAIKDPVTKKPTGETVRFRDWFLTQVLDNPEVFTGDVSALRYGAKMAEAVDVAIDDGSGKFVVDDAAHDLLSQAINGKGRKPAHPTLAMQLLPFMEAIEKAETI